MDSDTRADAAAALNSQLQSGYTNAGTANTQAYGNEMAAYQPYATQGQQALGQYSGLAAQDPNAYLKANNIDPTQNWQFNGQTDQQNIAQYMNPAMAFQMQQGVGAMDASAAAKGNLFAGGYGKELQNYGQQLGQTAYQNAFQNMTSSKNQAYQVYSDRLKNLMGAREQQLGALGNLVGVGENAAKGQAGAAATQGQNAMDIAMGSAQSQGQADAAKKMSGWNWGDTMRTLGGVADLASGADWSGFGQSSGGYGGGIQDPTSVGPSTGTASTSGFSDLMMGLNPTLLAGL